LDPASESHSIGFRFRTQFSWVLCQDPKLTGLVEDPRLQDPRFLNIIICIIIKSINVKNIFICVINIFISIIIKSINIKNSIICVTNIIIFIIIIIIIIKNIIICIKNIIIFTIVNIINKFEKKLLSILKNNHKFDLKGKIKNYFYYCYCYYYH